MSGNPHLRIVEPTDGNCNELEVRTALWRRFSLVTENQPVEVVAFTDGPIYVSYATSEADQIRLAREAENLRGFRGCYVLVNGPINPEITYRYELNTWCNAKPGRANDSDIQLVSAVFIDVDPVRPKNISSTDAEHRAAWEVSARIREFLVGTLGDKAAIGHGSSGNGFFSLVALEPFAPTKETTLRVSEFLKLLNREFGTDAVKVDGTTFNPARLMPAPGTWKRKGRNAPERPHRLTTFTCAPDVRRVALEALC